MEKKDTDWFTLEECVKQAVREGNVENVAILLKLLPEHLKQKYREIWKQVKQDMGAKKV